MRTEMKESSHLQPLSTVTGTVVHGRGIGKCVGTPTANLETGRNTVLPETGVYAAEILLNSRIYYGVTHVGLRPTLDEESAVSVETHIFNFDREIYGQTMTVRLYKKLREVKKFNELSLLIEQVEADRLQARKFWGMEQAEHAFSIDVKRHCVMIDGREVYLSATEFKLLHLLYLSPDVTFTKKQIYETVWREPANDHLHAVENTVFQIRKRLRPYCKEHEYIKTVTGYGYRFQPD